MAAVSIGGKPAAPDLRRIYLFEAMNDAQLETIRRTMRVRELDESERLFDFGQPPTQFFYLSDGQIKLFRNSADGYEKVIEVLRSGDTFAEAVMFMQRMNGYPVSAEAISPSCVWAFDSATMTDILHESVDSCFHLLANLSIRLRHHVDEIERLTLHNATFRVVNFLLRQVPEGTEPGTGVRLSMPKNVLASRLAIQPETFSRILARLTRSGLLRVQRNDIVLEDLDGLRALADPDRT
jgi:CRP-like cAMP-binding protein